MKVSLKKIIVPQIHIAVLMVVSCLLLWVAAYLAGPASEADFRNNYVVSFLQTLIVPRTLFSDLYSISFLLLNAYLIAQINNRFTIIRSRTFLPILIFLILMCTWDETHEVNGSHITLTLFIFSLFYFMGMYRDKNSTENAFMGSFLIGLSSLINNPLIFLMPACWIGISIFQSLSLRTILASIFGVVAPWILFFSGIYYFHPDTDFLHIFNTGFYLHPELLSLTLIHQIYLISILIVLAICIVGMFSISSGDVIRTRNNLYFLLILLFTVLFISLFFDNQSIIILPIIAMLYSIIASHPFTLKLNTFYGILFIFFCTINIAFVVLKFFITE